MTTGKMTVHKALSELKTMDARIQKTIDDCTFVVANKHSNTKIKGKPIAAFCDEAKAGWRSANDLIRRRDAIKRAVVLSNAVAKVSINGMEYTVAEAIEMKNHGIGHLHTLLMKLIEDEKHAQKEADSHNGKELETRADAYIKDLFGNADPKNLSDEVKKARADFMETQTFELIDPLNIHQEIERLQNEINDFMVEIDSALSVANALTEIEFSY